jgi:hypothetical protein
MDFKEMYLDCVAQICGEKGIYTLDRKSYKKYSDVAIYNKICILYIL